MSQSHDVSVTLASEPLNEIDEFGTDVRVTRINGWRGSGSTGEVTQKASAHGGWSGPAHRPAKLVTLELYLLGPDWATVSQTIERIETAIPLAPTGLLVVDDGDATQAYVQQRGDVLIARGEDAPRMARMSIGLTAPDPRRYDTNATVLSTGLPQTSGGLTLPFSLPTSISATVASGEIVAANDGNMDSPPTFRVDGPCPPFSLTLQSTGQTLTFHDSIPSGRYLLLDAANQTVLLDGTAARYVSGSWFTYAPGENTVLFAAETFDASALLTSTHRHAWK